MIHRHTGPGGMVIAALLLIACDPGGGEALTVTGFLYDAEPSVVLNDPAGVVPHRLADGEVHAYDVGSEALNEFNPDTGITSLWVAEAAFSDSDVGAFTLTGERVVEGARLALVANAPGRSPTVFTGELPVVSDRYDWFRFFDGAIFTEEVAALAARVEALSGEGSEALPDEAEVGNGCLLFGQLLSDPSLVTPSASFAVEGAEVSAYSIDGSSLRASYLSDTLEVDASLGETSTSGAFYVAGVPEGPVEIRVTAPDGSELSPPFSTLCVEDGMTWLTPFYLMGVAPQLD